MDLLRHLELFEAVAHEAHFGRAAEALGISQPPLSQAIRRLEREMGCALFDRTSHGAVLTPAGRRVLEVAGRMRADATSLRAVAATTHHAPVRVMVDPAVPEDLLAAVVSRSVSQGITVQLESVATVGALQRVRAGDGPAVALAPFRTEGLRSSAPRALPLWSSRLSDPSDVRREGISSGGTALVHPAPSAAAMTRLSENLRGLGLPGPITSLERNSALGGLLTGDLEVAVTVEDPGWRGNTAGLIRAEPLPRSRASAVVQVVVRRDERERSVLEAFETVSQALAGEERR